ncbi:MAG: hypothetical protein IPK10_17575 [Bacteroidetes bacterium]|nr:hypothetical protein [Bacteroidota bacterium]
MIKLRTLLTVIFCSFALCGNSQSAFLPLSNEVEQGFVKDLNRVGNGVHTSFKPYLRSDVVRASMYSSEEGELDEMDFGKVYDSLIGMDVRKDRKFNQRWIGRKIFTEHLLQVEEEDFRLYLDPVFEFLGGQDQENDRNFHTNTRGVWASGSIGKRFGFNATFYENQSFFPLYLDSAARKSRVVPGQGRVKKFETSAFDYAFSTGTINFQLNKHFTFEFGQDRHFIGDGYRSLLLSDNAFHYPYFKIITDFWKIRYVNLFMQLRNLERIDQNDEYPFQSKYASMHYLDVDIGKHLTVGLFESVIWHADSTAPRGFDIGYMNPFIFLRPVEFSIGSPDNVLMGLNLKVKLNSKNLLYGQVMLDEFLFDNVVSNKGWWANKQGIQAGFKSVDVFGVKTLFLQGELNYVRPYTYQHRDELGSYSHHRGALAHPLGANFWEMVGIDKYTYKRWNFDARLSYAEVGYDSSGSNWGQNIFLSYNTRVQEFGNEVGQGLKTKLMWANLNISFLLNPNNRMNVFVNVASRSAVQPNKTENTILIQGGFRTNLFNRYYDF